MKRREFPGSPVARTWYSHCPGAEVQSLVLELGSCKSRGMAKKKKEKEKERQRHRKGKK